MTKISKRNKNEIVINKNNNRKTITKGLHITTLLFILLIFIRFINPIILSIVFWLKEIIDLYVQITDINFKFIGAIFYFIFMIIIFKWLCFYTIKLIKWINEMYDEELRRYK